MSSQPPLMYEVVATVPTGLERGAAEECRELLGRQTQVHRGSISCLLHSVEELGKLDQLRSIDNYHAVVGTLPTFCAEESSVLERLEALPSTGELDWTAALSLWHYYYHNIMPHPPGMEPGHKQASDGMESGHSDVCSGGGMAHDQTTAAVEDAKCTELRPSGLESRPDGIEPSQTPGTESKPLEMESRPGDGTESRPYHSILGSLEEITFRVTGTRGGRKHCFSSQDAAKHFGAGLLGWFGWRVQLKGSAIEVLLDISGDAVKVGVALTREPKFKRNISHFGPTTLRSTIAYGMLRVANIKEGDIVLDPLCGGGSINIEGSLSWPLTYHLSGDYHVMAVNRTASNISSLLRESEDSHQVSKLKVGVTQWDVCNLPLRTGSVDVVVTDLPFGKKSGSRRANWELYPNALREMGRVCRPHTSRAVLLTHDHKVLSRSLQKEILWRRIKTLWVNVGGLEAALFVLHRSSALYNNDPSIH